MSDDEIAALVEQLRSFRTRGSAARRLAEFGKAAVPALVAALEDDAFESARWTVLNCLGELDAEEAVPALAGFLSNPDYQVVAHDSLVRVTGQDFGLVAEGWLRWVRREQVSPPPKPEDLPDDQLLELALEGVGATWRPQGENRYAVDYPVAGGRTREVVVVFGVTDHEGEPAVVVYCNCGEADPERYEAVLRSNLRVPYGAYALRDIGGKPHFVMFNTVLRQALSPVELRKSIAVVADRSDRMRDDIRP